MVVEEAYSKQRSENTTQAKAVTTCATLPFAGNFLGAGENLSLLWITAVCCLCILIFVFKIKPHSAAVKDAYWLSPQKLESSFQLALLRLEASAAIDHLINWKKIKGTVICVSALLLSSWQSACFCLEQWSAPWPCDLKHLFRHPPPSPTHLDFCKAGGNAAGSFLHLLVLPNTSGVPDTSHSGAGSAKPTSHHLHEGEINVKNHGGSRLIGGKSGKSGRKMNVL